MKQLTDRLQQYLPSNPDLLRQRGLILFNKLIRTKNPASLQEDPIHGGGKDQGSLQHKKNLQSMSMMRERIAKLPHLVSYKKCLTTLDLTSLGIGSCVGTGMYLVAGMVARTVAGPGVILSFIIAAVASIFSGACYAEFGVRVPHTSGSAYMYSYVTVGEFIAFIIGWNMVLEYLIGTSACACALSACFDAISSGAITEKLTNSIGTFYGQPPDILAFFITLIMMVVLIAGVQKSVQFNNVLNAINLAVWVFIMTAGLFYIDFSNWTDYGGFLPFGWSGVLKGSATCFYAFIGFDIIATTGEEATNPKKSIPIAIVGSLVVILVAYVTSSAMLTLIVPYDEVSQDSALVEMFGQVGAQKCQYVVAIGALAGLTVSMFGSMFPMPRIVYAMAKDGLIFQWLSEVWSLTGTPAIATVVLGVMAALAALVIQLEVLVEMMSIGTLLAYTLVSTCVLLLRYQPTSTTLVDMLPESIRTPLRGTPVGGTPTGSTTPTKDYGASLFLQNQSGGQTSQQQDAFRSSAYPHVPHPVSQRLSLSLGIGSNLLSGSNPPVGGGPVLVRKVTRNSPDSDDTDTIGDTEADDAFLMGDRNESRYYGSVHAGASPRMSRWEKQMRLLQYLCPKLLPWKESGPCTEETGRIVTKLAGLLFLQIVVFDLILVAYVGSTGFWSSVGGFLLLLLFGGIMYCLLTISRKPQNNKTLLFMTPGLPFVPAIAVMVNFYLILKLSILTLVRFTIWMTLGFIMYFKYGIKNSVLEVQDDPAVELTVAGGSPSVESISGIKTTSLSTHR